MFDIWSAVKPENVSAGNSRQQNMVETNSQPPA